MKHHSDTEAPLGDAEIFVGLILIPLILGMCVILLEHLGL